MRTYEIDVRPVSFAAAEAISVAYRNIGGGLEVVAHLADDYRDTDYRYTLTYRAPRAVNALQRARLQGIAEGIAHVTR
jgi:hypothetical protein